MKLIAHRGLYNGPDKNLENRPYQINSALGRGFDCEIDLWVFDDRLYLGHDGPQYNITEDFLQQSGLWIHCKNLADLKSALSAIVLFINISRNITPEKSDSMIQTTARQSFALPAQLQ